MQRAEVVTSQAEAVPHVDPAVEGIQKLAAAEESDRAWRAARRPELEQAVKRLDRFFFVTAGGSVVLAPLITNFVLFLVRAESGFARTGFVPAFISAMVTILVLAVTAGVGTVLFVQRRKTLLRELADLSADGEEAQD